MLTKKALFRHKMCHDLKIIKAIKNFCAYVDLSLLRVCFKFHGKVTRNKQVRGKKRPLIFIQVPPFIFKV